MATEFGNPDRIKRTLFTREGDGLWELSQKGIWIGTAVVDSLMVDDNLPESVAGRPLSVVAISIGDSLLVPVWAAAADLAVHGDEQAAMSLGANPDAALIIPASRAEFTPFPEAA